MSNSLKTRRIGFTAIAIIIIGFIAYLIFRSHSVHQQNWPTDVNHDGITNETDQELVKQKFGKSCSGCSEDISGDGLVDGSDLLLLIGAFESSK
jgi:hypothetical protein